MKSTILEIYLYNFSFSRERRRINSKSFHLRKIRVLLIRPFKRLDLQQLTYLLHHAGVIIGLIRNSHDFTDSVHQGIRLLQILLHLRNGFLFYKSSLWFSGLQQLGLNISLGFLHQDFIVTLVFAKPPLFLLFFLGWECVDWFGIVGLVSGSFDLLAEHDIAAADCHWVVVLRKGSTPVVKELLKPLCHLQII